MASRNRRRSISDYAALVQKEILSCPGEQPVVGGVFFWLSHRPISVDDLLMHHRVPDDLATGVVKLLRCPKCGEPIDRYSDVGTKTDAQIGHESCVCDALEKHCNELMDFHGFLTRTPLLGASHRFGKRIIRELKHFPRNNLDQETWYRARKTLDHGFGPTPAHFAMAGRYNCPGQVRPCYADSPEGAVAEVGTFTQTDPISAFVKEFRFPPEGNYLDLRAWDSGDERALNEHSEYEIDLPSVAVALIFSDYLTRAPQQNVIAKREYVMTV